MTVRDPDVVKARRLVELLGQLAEKLERSDQDLADQIDPKVAKLHDPNVDDDPLVEACKLKANARLVIQKLHDAWMSLDHTRPDTREWIRQAWLIQDCRRMGEALVALRQLPQPFAWDEDFHVTNAVDMVVTGYAEMCPEYADGVTRNRDTVRRLIVAFMGLGGLTIDAAGTELCDSMGWDGTDYATLMHKARLRARKN